LTQRGLPLFVHEAIARKIRSPWEPINEDEAVLNNGISNIEGNIPNFVKMACSNEEPDTTLIPKIACPTLVVWGKNDNVIPYQHAYKFQRDIPTCQVLMYDTCGHVPMQEYPQRLNKDVRTFFAE
jgi:pimeloyl-ACP methyl ester carboxylesterase